MSAKFTKKGPHLLLNEETGVFYVRKTFRRFRIPDLFESLRETRITAARVACDAAIEKHKKRYLGGGQEEERALRHGTSVTTVIDEMLVTLTPRRRAKTQYTHKLYFKELKQHWGAIDVNRITLAMWERWLAEFKPKKRKRKTFNDYVKHMNLVLNYAYQHRYLKHPLALPTTDPVKGVTGRVYTDAELAALWEHMNETLRDQFVLSFECFMRLREVLFLTWDRIDLSTGKLTLRAADVKTGSKTGKGRSFFVSPNALMRLRARRVAQGEGSPYVFPSRFDPSKPQAESKTAWIAAKRRAGIKGRARWHDIRHTSLTLALLVKKLNPLEVSEFAGVNMRTIQKVYLHSTEEQTRSVSTALSILGFQSI